MKRVSTRQAAFTLIELLVVIAIIGILAAALFPAVSGAIVRANATAMGNRGKNVVMAIIAANIEREQFSLPSIWPREGDANYNNAVGYFAEMIAPQQEGRKPRIENIDWTYFAGGGVPAAPNREDFVRDGTHMGWRTVFNIRETDADSAPFMITRNMEFEIPAAEEEFSGDMLTLLPGDSPDENPFGRRMVVWVMKGGAVQSVRPDLLYESVDVNPEMFMPVNAFNSPDADLVFP